MIKRKIKSFFDNRVAKITDLQNELFLNLNQRLDSLQSKLQENEQKISQLEQQITNTKQELSLSEQRLQTSIANVNNQIITTENNLNYYNMIDSIRKENKYINPELFYLELGKLKNKKILLAGFYGADNLGDELMLQSVLNFFPQEKLSDITVLLCDNEGYDYSHLPAVNFLHYPKSIFDYNILAQEFDTLVWGGGTLIDDNFYNDKSTSLNNMLVDLSLRFIAFDKKVFALGLSSNKELSNFDYIDKLKTVCENSVAFTLRDKYSFELLKSHGIKNITMSDDLIFYNKIWSLMPLPEKNKGDTVKIGIIWICQPDTEEALNIILSKLYESYGNSNLEIVLIPFYNYFNIDISYYNEIISNNKYKGIISVCNYSNNLETIIKKVNQMDFIVNMRYHGMLICGMLNKKSFNICYDSHPHYPNKIKYLNEIFGIPDSVLLSDISDKTEISFSLPLKKTHFESQEFEKLISYIVKD